MIIPVVKTYPAEAGTYSVNNGLQVLGGYGFCSDFHSYNNIIEISEYLLFMKEQLEFNLKILLGRKITMNNGEGLKLLVK